MLLPQPPFARGSRASLRGSTRNSRANVGPNGSQFSEEPEMSVIFHSSPTSFGSPRRTRDDVPMPRAPWMLRIGVCPSRPSRRKLTALRKDSVMKAGSRPRSNINGAFFRPENSSTRLVSRSLPPNPTGNFNTGSNAGAGESFQADVHRITQQCGVKITHLFYSTENTELFKMNDLVLAFWESYFAP